MASGPSSISGMEAEGAYVYGAGQGRGLVILDVADSCRADRRSALFAVGATVVDVAVRDTLVAVATPTSVVLMGVPRPCQSAHASQLRPQAASWIEFEPDSLRLHVGSTTGAFSLRIIRHVGGDTTLSLGAPDQYGTTPMSPLAVVGPYVDVARGAHADGIGSGGLQPAGERQATAAVRAVTGIHSGTSNKVFIALANGEVEYLRHQAGSGAPVFVAGATLPAAATGLAMAQSGTQSLVVATHTNGVSVLVYDAAPVTPHPVAAIPESLTLSAYPNPFNAVVELRTGRAASRDSTAGRCTMCWAARCRAKRNSFPERPPRA